MKKNIWSAMIVLLFSCSSNRVFEDNVDLYGNFWSNDQIVSFDFSIEDPALTYDLYANFRNASAYPYYNLYFQYTLADSSGNIIEEKLKNVNLFDSKTGKPYGSGLGDLFDHQFRIIDNHRFTSPGTYTLSFEQYMRKDTLPLILSVGARVEWSMPE